MARRFEQVELIAVPCNLGLRPQYPGHVPGTWRAPERLIAAGLSNAVRSVAQTWLDRLAYSPDPQPDTRLYNGNALRRLNLELAESVNAATARSRFPLVVGGDCSILLGALAGARRSGPVALIHLDGHSDFRHPGNYDPQAMLGAVAGMDLALATGRGEPLLSEWPGIDGPLVPDRSVIQIGEREDRDPNYAWRDIAATGISRINAFDAAAIGASGVVERVRAILNGQDAAQFWLHLDVDVLDRNIMPAVDSPGFPGISLEDLKIIGRALLTDQRCCGMTVTVFDPDLDPAGNFAALIVALLSAIFC